MLSEKFDAFPVLQVDKLLDWFDKACYVTILDFDRVLTNSFHS